jgi:hypothetical protein
MLHLRFLLGKVNSCCAMVIVNDVDFFFRVYLAERCCISNLATSRNDTHLLVYSKKKKVDTEKVQPSEDSAILTTSFVRKLVYFYICPKWKLCKFVQLHKKI